MSVHRSRVFTLPRAALLALLCLSCTTPPAHSAELIQPGQKLPAWRMVDQTGAAVSSTDLIGRTYLLWYYPRAMTPGCTAEGNALRDNYEQFRAQGVEIFGVSFDAPAANAEFVRAQEFPYRLLSDGDRALAVQVGAAQSSADGAARRISYLIGPDGAVLRAYPNVDPADHAAQVLRDLAAVKAK